MNNTKLERLIVVVFIVIGVLAFVLCLDMILHFVHWSVNL